MDKAEIKKSMTDKPKKWKALSRETIFQKYGREIEKVMFRLPDGTESDFYIKKEGPANCVLALTKDNQVILAKQYRPGPDEIVLELQSGKTTDVEVGYMGLDHLGLL